MKIFHSILIFATLISFEVSVLASQGQDSRRHAIEWISLYGGQEVSFSSSDRSRILSALNALGIDHRDDSSKEILVSSDERSVVQDLVARILSQSSGT